MIFITVLTNFSVVWCNNGRGTSIDSGGSRECVQEELRAAYAADQQAREEGDDVDETQPPSPSSSHVFKITL